MATDASASGDVNAAPSQASAAPSQAIPEQPLPVPDGSRILAVVDPEVAMPEVKADRAIELARANFSGGVGQSPSVQLATVAFRDPGSDLTPVWTGWIILSTDVMQAGGGGLYLGPDVSPAPAPPTVAPHTWVFVTVDGEVLHFVQGPVGSTEPPLPMPDADLISIVHDPALYPQISADEAIALARENPSGLVGASPRVQLVSTITDRPELPLDGFTGWVVLSADVPGHLYGPITAPSVTEYATYSWVFVKLDGEVLVATQNTYITPDSVPVMPDG